MIFGGASAQRGPLLQVMGAEVGDKTPHFGPDGAEICEKTVFLRTMAILGQKGKIRSNLKQFDVLEPISTQICGVS